MSSKAVKVVNSISAFACNYYLPATTSLLSSNCLPACSRHEFANRGVGATSSSIFAICLDRFVAQVTDYLCTCSAL